MAAIDELEKARTKFKENNKGAIFFSGRYAIVGRFGAYLVYKFNTAPDFDHVASFPKDDICVLFHLISMSIGEGEMREHVENLQNEIENLKRNNNLNEERMNEIEKYLDECKELLEDMRL